MDEPVAGRDLYAYAAKHMAGGSASLKIVTVENSPIIVTRLSEMLLEIEDAESLGNAINFEDAWDLISRCRPDVVIADIHLGSGARSGIDLLRQIREKLPSLKVVILSNHAETGYRSLCLGHGANCFLDKSNEFDLIPDLIAAWSKERAGFLPEDIFL